jgi:hypothetical protein
MFPNHRFKFGICVCKLIPNYFEMRDAATSKKEQRKAKVSFASAWPARRERSVTRASQRASIVLDQMAKPMIRTEHPLIGERHSEVSTCIGLIGYSLPLGIRLWCSPPSSFFSTSSLFFAEDQSSEEDILVLRRVENTAIG